MGLLEHMATLFLCNNFKYLHIILSASVNSVLFEFLIVSKILYSTAKNEMMGMFSVAVFLACVKILT